MTKDELELSARIDEARANEELYRTLLVFWRQRRQRLERQIPATGIMAQIIQIVEGAWGQDDNDDKGIIQT